ncbi:MAG TPA: hypothetical protein VLL05_19265 [Terriglobales bacterium]|nr:hypothetical protein [Terriglobales bacterium]
MTFFSRRYRYLSTFLVLAGSIAASAQAQPGPVPAAPQRPGNPAAPGGEGPSKMAPTGMAANGGAIANDVYTNTTYGFSMKLPPGWVVVPSKNPVAPSASPREEALMQAAQVNHVLLVLTENAPMKKSTQRKSIQIVATRLLKKPSPNEGQEYLVYSKRTALEKKMPVEYTGDPTEVTINGNKFWTIGLNQTMGQEVQHVEQYVAMQGSALLQFLIVSPDEKGLKDMEPSIQSIDMKPITEKPVPARAPRKKKPAAPAK